MTTSTIWLLSGIAFMLLEAFGLPGIGFLFAGFGALTVGMLVYVLPDISSNMQWIVFFASAAAWAALLWKPLQKLRLPQPGKGYNNMIGDTAYAGSGGITKAKGGEATWSGTIMKAQLADDAGVDNLEAGTAVTITDVSGVTLIVKPK